MTADQADDRAGVMRSADRVPSPDPTALTTSALYREVASLRELLTQRFDALERERDLTSAASMLRQDVLNRERTEQLMALKEILERQIADEAKLVAQQFDLIERQRLEQKQDTKTAVDAALQAQKEAVREQTTASALSIAKSETATTKQLEQQQVTTATAVGDLRRSIDELKERIGEDARILRQAISDVASTANSTVQQKVGAREDRTGLYAAIGIVATVLFAIIAVAGILAARSGV